MLTLNCASCGAAVNFHSKASVFAVCSFCKSTLVRQDMNLDVIGSMADLQDDYSPLQIGTQGLYEGKKFEIVGRLKVAYDGGFWHEWFTWFDTDTTGWLAAAQGFLAMCFTVEDLVPASENLKPGTVLPLKGRAFQVDDIRQAHCVYSEGELPINAVKGRQALSVDLSGKDAQMATIEYPADNSKPRIFVGTYQDFDQFKFKNLRKLDGW